MQSQPATRPMIRYPVRLVASLTGYAITAFIVWWQWTSNFGGLPPDLAIWDRVGDQVIQGMSPYAYLQLDWTELFFYVPPWALAFALTGWLPVIAQAGLVMAIGLASFRYIAGSWLRVGYFGLIPLTGAELGNGSFNLLVAAGIGAGIMVRAACCLVLAGQGFADPGGRRLQAGGSGAGCGGRHHAAGLALVDRMGRAVAVDELALRHRLSGLVPRSCCGSRRARGPRSAALGSRPGGGDRHSGALQLLARAPLPPDRVRGDVAPAGSGVSSGGT